MASISVRAANLEDLTALTSLWGEVQALHHARRPDQFKPVDSLGIGGRVAELLGDPAAWIWVAELGSTVAGYVVVQPQTREENVWCPARTWWQIDQLGVAAAQRRRGVARALVQHVLAEAKTRNVSRIELSSWAFNTDAHAAFESLGFVPRTFTFEHRSSRPGTGT